MASLFFILGLICGATAGFYGRAVINRLEEIKTAVEERKTYQEAGIVKPKVVSVPRVDLTTPTGGVRRPTPEQYAIANMKARDERLRNM